MMRDIKSECCRCHAPLMLEADSECPPEMIHKLTAAVCCNSCQPKEKRERRKPIVRQGDNIPERKNAGNH